MVKKKIEAVFIGRGLPKDPLPTYVGWGLAYLTPDGSITADITESENGTLYGIRVVPGKLQQLPTWDEATLRAVVASENFARADFEQKINDWLNSGITGDALAEKVKGEGGLIALKDVGLEEIEDSPVPPNNGG